MIENLSASLFEPGQYYNAVERQKELVEICQSGLGDDDPRTILYKENLASYISKADAVGQASLESGSQDVEMAIAPKRTSSDRQEPTKARKRLRSGSLKDAESQ